MTTWTHRPAARGARLQAAFVLRAPRERGQALLLLMLLLSLGAVLLVYGSTTEVGRMISAENRTRHALEQAKQALIGRAIADANRPGSLPCPDSNDDGRADLFFGTVCPAYLGRLPWRTLGIGDLRDETGERLWYALSPNFRDHPSAPPLNSDTKGTLTLHHTSTATTVTTQAIAIVFSAGVILPGQIRDNVSALCNSTGTMLPRKRCPSNYLDTTGTVSNAVSGGPYIASASAEAFNDKLAIIISADVMPLVEQRVALELRNALLAYRSTSPCRCYPWADNGADGVSDSGANQGRIPHVTALPDNWPPGALPSYFGPNDWGRIIYYAVGKSALQNGGKSCKTCVDPNLSVDTTSGHDVVLIVPGYAGAGRPSTRWSDYLDDPENRDGDDRFVTPVSPSADRDRLYSVTGAAAGCAVNARVLVSNAPCGSPGSLAYTVCQAAVTAIGACACAPAAAAMIKAPCTHTLISSACQSAVSALQSCGS